MIYAEHYYRRIFSVSKEYISDKNKNPNSERVRIFSMWWTLTNTFGIHRFLILAFGVFKSTFSLQH